jgi:transcriptional/translational regulatory protein YebC/TACO1
VTSKVRSFSDAKYQVQSAESPWLPLPGAQMQLDVERTEKISRLLATLEADADITAVYTNAILHS